jgi:hypothetical protein
MISVSRMALTPSVNDLVVLQRQRVIGSQRDDQRA